MLFAFMNVYDLHISYITHAAYVIYHKNNNSCVFVVNGKENLSSD